MSSLLSIKNLNVEYDGIPILKNINLDINQGEVLGVVGESGSGKSTLLKSIISILGNSGIVTEGEIIFDNMNLLEISNEELRSIRGNKVSFISQNPGASFCPVKTIEKQFIEAVKAHKNINKYEIKNKITDIFSKINLRDVRRILKSYPFELSGGMNQRVGVALAMINNPKLILADEPTSALDVTAQAQVVKTLMDLRNIFNTSIIIVTHNITVVEYMADNIAVMYHGTIVEYGIKKEIIKNPIHPYTKLLIDSTPTMNSDILSNIPQNVVAVDKRSKGCPFAPRCNKRMGICNLEIPKPIKENNRIVACHLYNQVRKVGVL